ncbi:MAG: hypothetical protein H6733_14815 [Alphaproteobacteria bacterium]|nr:hypothetical protein [Alphaproteobacteria bacterium]
MGKGTHRMVTPEWIGELVAATFGGKAPSALEGWVDAEVCAERIEGSKIGAVFTAGAAEAPALRLSHQGESERLAALAASAFPAAADWLARFAGKDVLFETDGSSLRLYVTSVDDPPPGVMGFLWQDGVEGELRGHDGLPAGLPADVATAAKDFVAKVDGGMFITLTIGGATSFMWASEGAWSPELEAVIAGLGMGPKQKAATKAYADANLAIQPYSVEFQPGGTVRVCLWGAHLGRDVADLPDAFGSGAPDAATFAEELVTTLPPDDADAGRAFIRDQLYPSVVALKPADTDLPSYLVHAWRVLLGHLAFEAPPDRLLLLQRLHASARLAGIEKDAYQLAVARYLASHPDAQPPADLPDTLVGLSVDQVRDHAQALTDEVAALQAVADADADFEQHHFPGAEFSTVTIKDLLERALSGNFAAASGALHEFMIGLGVLGYDDDPSLITLDNVDLEAASQDAAIEEALAMDFDDED